MIEMNSLHLGENIELEKFTNRIKNVLKHGKFILGPEVGELEAELAKFSNVKHCISCANGTDALQIALMSIGVGPGDEVIVPAFSYIAPAEAVKLLGGTVVYADICEESFNIDPKSIALHLTEKTKAIIAVNLFGQCADFDNIRDVIKGSNIKLIEDAAQSFGALHNGQPSCSLADISCTSFFPTKPLGCFGDGGAIFCANDLLAAKIRKIARHGQSKKYVHDIVGINSRLDTVQAAILLEKITELQTQIFLRNSIANLYTELFSQNLEIKTPAIADYNESAWAQYTIRLNKRDEMAEKLLKNGIKTTIHYPMALHRQKAVAVKTSLPVSELVASEVLSIPIDHTLKRKQIEYIANAIICAL